MKPPDVNQRLTDVIGTDPRFVISGSEHTKSVSSTGLESATAPAAPAAAAQARQPPPTDFPRNPGRGACPFFMKEGYCGRGMNCKFDHPSHVVQDLKHRPHKSDCRFYMEKGFCGHGLGCSLNHPPRAAPSQPQSGEAPPTVFPQHPEREVCKNYMKNGVCPYMQLCHWHHPPRLPKTLTPKP